jgi:hypothetical protein
LQLLADLEAAMHRPSTQLGLFVSPLSGVAPSPTSIDGLTGPQGARGIIFSSVPGGDGRMATGETSPRALRLSSVRALIIVAMVSLPVGFACARGGSSGSAGAAGGHGNAASGGGSEHDHGRDRHRHFVGGWTDEIGNYGASWDPWVEEAGRPNVEDFSPRDMRAAPPPRRTVNPQSRSASAEPERQNTRSVLK